MRTLAVVAALVGSLAVTATAQAVGTATRTAVPVKAPDYRYKQVDPGEGAGFEAVGFNDSTWSTGAAGFGTTNGTCPFNNSSFIGTSWDVNSDILLRKHFELPASAHNLEVNGTVDNDATVYINGQQIGFAQSGFCNIGAIDFAADDSTLVAGDNLLAVRGHDAGVAAYIDQEVTYQVPVYAVCLLYDPAKSHKSGSTVPLKIQLCDENGANVSSPDIVVHATELTKTDNNAAAAVEDSGNANPGDDFRYDASLAGYIFNKSTKGLSSGTWRLSFEVDGDHDAAYELPFDVR